tara:strand:- start:3489 stop:4754 length:1266 start_codon:yes stop_codon:yes gene_type:complete
VLKINKLVQQSPWFYGWTVVGTVCLTNFTAVVFFNPILGVFSSDLEIEFGWSRASVAAAISIGSVAAAAASPITGWMVDRWGGRWVLAVASLLISLVLLYLIELKYLWQLYLAYAIGRGLSMAAVSNVGFVVVNNWFIAKRSTAVGFVAVSQRIGMALLPLYVATVITISGNWRIGWVALGLVVLFFGVFPPAFFIRRRPEDIGLVADGGVYNQDVQDQSNNPFNQDFSLNDALHTRAYWLIGMTIAIAMFTGGSINFHQIPYMMDKGFSSTAAALVVMIYSFVGAVGAVLGGYFADKFTARKTMILSFLIMSVGPLLLLHTDSLSFAMVYAITYGLFFGSSFALSQAIYADYFGRTSLGVIRGSFQPVQLILNAAGPFFTGLWVDHFGSYAVPFFLFSGCMLLAALLLVLATYPKKREVL